MRIKIFKSLIYTLITCVAISCSKSTEEIEEVIPTMTITVTDIVENRATISANMLTGEAVAAKVVDFYPINDIGIDYNTEVKLVQFVESNGVEVSLPYNRKIETGLKPGVTYISAIIAYNDKGRAVCSAYAIWQAPGTEGLWSDDNSAGELEENNW